MSHFYSDHYMYTCLLRLITDFTGEGEGLRHAVMLVIEIASCGDVHCLKPSSLSQSSL